MAIEMAVKRGSLTELLFYFLRLGLLGFGGPVALVGQMERELVAERGWLTKEQMREASGRRFLGFVGLDHRYFLPFIHLHIGRSTAACEARRQSKRARVRARRLCGGNRHYPRSLHSAGPDCHRRLAYSFHRLGIARGLVPLESQQSSHCSNHRDRPDCLPAAAAGLGDGQIVWKLNERHGADTEGSNADSHAEKINRSKRNK
jgi:hypothetical protein